MDDRAPVCVVAPDAGPTLAPCLADLSAALRSGGFEPLTAEAGAGDTGAYGHGANDRQRMLVDANRAVANARLSETAQAEAVLALLDGTDVDAGVAARVGWAAAFGTPVVGLRLDPRPAGQNTAAPVNFDLACVIERSGGALVTTVPAAVAALLTVVEDNAQVDHNSDAEVEPEGIEAAATAARTQSFSALLGPNTDGAERITDALAQMHDAKARQTLAEQTAAQAEAEVAAAVQRLGRVASVTSARDAVVRYLYWEARHLRVQWIADAFGLKHVHRVIEAAGPYGTGAYCDGCDNEVMHTSRSGTDGRSIRIADGTAYLCGSCWNNVQHQRSASYAQDRAAAKDRLAALKSMPYSEYLQTEEWQQRRAQALRKAKYRCQVCNRGNCQLHVHHRTYERRGEEWANDLIVLCGDCHETFHINRVVLSDGGQPMSRRLDRSAGRGTPGLPVPSG